MIKADWILFVLLFAVVLGMVVIGGSMLAQNWPLRLPVQCSCICPEARAP